MKKILYLIFPFILITHSLFASNGVYLEYSQTLIKTGRQSGTIKVYSSKGDTKAVSEIMFGNQPWVLQELYLKKNQNLHYTLYSNKTYTIENDEDYQLSEYEVTLLGNDTINGYSCIKIALNVYKKDKSELTVWITNQIPNFAAYQTAVVSGIYLDRLNIALTKQNLFGIPVRIISSYEGSGSQDDLKLAEERNIDNDIFSLKGYEKAKPPPSDEELLENKKITKEQYDLMKIEEIKIKKLIEQRDSTKNKN